MSFCLLSADAIHVENELTFTLELFLSILAVIISIFAVFFEYYWSQKINRTNLEADFYKDIYGDYLMNKLPEARRVILYSNHVISDTDDLIDILNDIRHSSLFYKYKDKNFYEKLCGQLQKLEDKLVKDTGKVIEDDYYIDFTRTVNKDIEDIYNTIMDKYIGK